MAMAINQGSSKSIYRISKVIMNAQLDMELCLVPQEKQTRSKYRRRLVQKWQQCEALGVYWNAEMPGKGGALCVEV